MRGWVPEVAGDVGIDDPEVFEDVLNVFEAESAVLG